MAVVLSNNATSLLAGAITAGATTLSIENGDASKFPNPAAGDWFPLTIVDNAGNMEIVKATARAGGIITVTRAQEGTTAKAFSAGSRVDVRLTAAALSDFVTFSSKSILVKEAPGYGSLQISPGSSTRTGHIEGYLPDGKRGWYMGHAIANGQVTIAAENGVSGFAMSGALTVSGYTTINNSFNAVGTIAVRGNSDNTGNIHVFYQNYDQSVNHAITYWERANGDFVIVTGNSTYRFQAGGQFWSATDLVARGNVYAASGNAALMTNGNVTGSIWNNWGAGDSFTAIGARIEQRARDYADDRRNQCVTDTRSAGYVEHGFRAGDEIYNNAFDFNHSGYYLCRIYTNRNQWELYFGMRQPQIHIPNIGWRALGGW